MKAPEVGGRASAPDRTLQYLLLPGRSSCWAVPATLVERVRALDEFSAVEVRDASAELDFDTEARPKRIVELRAGEGLVALLAFGRTSIASYSTTEIVDVPDLLRRDPAARFARSVVFREGSPAAWILDVDRLKSMGNAQ